MTEIPDGAREKMAVWLADRESISYDDCDAGQQGEWLWKAEFVISEVLMLCDWEHEPWPEDSVYETMRRQRDEAELRSAESIRLSSDVMLAAKDAADRDGQDLDEWVSECVQYYLNGA